MPTAVDRLRHDLESMLHRALSRGRTGAWAAAGEMLERAGDLLNTLLAQLEAGDARLRRSFELLAELHTRLTDAADATRGELHELRQAALRLQPTRLTYGATARYGATPARQFAEQA